MRSLFLAASMLLVLTTHAQSSDMWTYGATIGFNCAQIQISGAVTPTKTTSVQPTPAFGAFVRTGFGSSVVYSIEFRVGYETAGANREIYYERAVDEWVRINDRYSTIPLSILGYRAFGAQHRLKLGAGVKAQYVARSRVRNQSSFPPGASGLVFEPEIKKLFPSVSAEAVWSAELADIAVTFCYAVAPLIDSQKIIVTPLSFALTVKKRLAFG